MEKLSFSPVDKDESLMTLHEAIFNTAGVSIISISLQGIVTSFNRTAETLLGFPAGQLIGRKASTQFLPEDQIHHVLGQHQHAAGEHGASLLEELFEFVKNQKNGLRANVNLQLIDGSDLSAHVVFNSFHEHGDDGLVMTVLSARNPENRESETSEELKAVIASVDDIVFEVDGSKRFRSIWVKSEDYLFMPREQILGRTMTEIFGSDFAKPFEEGLDRVLATGETFQYEYRSSKTNDDRWFVAKCSMVYDHGIPSGRVSICVRDITDRKNIELSLRHSEEKFRSLAESIPGVVFMMEHDSENSILYVNNKVTDVTGYGVDEFYQGKADFYKLIFEDDQLSVAGARSRSNEDKISYHVEYRFLHKSGEWRWLAETGVTVSTGSKTILEGFITDVTHRKHSSEELRRMADENSRIFNNSITLSAVTGFDGYFKKLNPAWEKTLSWSRDELLTKPFMSFLHPEDVKKTEEMLRIIMTGHTVTMFENRFRCKDGSYRWLLWGSSPDIGRKVIYASAIDITSRKKFEEELLISKRNLEVAAYELEEQNRQLDEFAHIISHNLRAPVANIKALLSFINETSQLPDYQLIFDKIKNVTHNIGETMNELMEMIKIRKTHEIERVEIRFKDVLDKVIQSLEGELIESGATVTYNFNNAPKIYYSKPYLESILQNLISNAIKYRSPERIPEIYVSTDIVISGIELRVQDNGLGIDLEQHGNKLFGLHKTFHENKEARGVGLFLTKTQIETMGGSIRADSKVNEGTTFVIHF